MRLHGLSTMLVGALLCQSASALGSTIPEFPFEFRDGLIWVQVRFHESPAPRSFLLDSGAGLSVINLPTLRRFSRLRGRRMTVRGVGATTTGYWPQHLPAAEGGLPLSDDFLAVDLSELGRACNRAVDGLVGADFFARHVVQIDFAARKIRLLPTSEGLPGSATLPLELHGRSFQVPLRVNGGAPQWVRLDTGCAAALHWVTARVRPQDCKPTLSVALTAVPVDMTQTAVQLGELQFDHVPTGVHKDQMFEGESGLLGNGLLSRFSSIIIDAEAGRLILVGPSTPAETTDSKN